MTDSAHPRQSSMAIAFHKEPVAQTVTITTIDTTMLSMIISGTCLFSKGCRKGSKKWMRRFILWKSCTPIGYFIFGLLYFSIANIRQIADNKKSSRQFNSQRHVLTVFPASHKVQGLMTRAFLGQLAAKLQTLYEKSPLSPFCFIPAVAF